MKRLLWKECRERGWWALLWVAGILGVSLLMHGQSFVGEGGVIPNPWQMLPLLFSVLVGVGMYNSELAGERATFIFSRPIAARSLLLAKLIFGAILVFGAPLLAALIFRLTCPEPYRDFVTLPHVLAGAWAVTWKLGLCYLVGMGCSVVAAGLFGSIATLIAILLIPITLAAVLGISEYDVLPTITLFVGTAVAILFGGLRLARFGLSLSIDERIKRYVVVVVPVILLFWGLGVSLDARWCEALLQRWEPVMTQISPSGKYAFVVQQRKYRSLGYSMPLVDTSFGEQTRGKVVRLADRKVVYRLMNNTEKDYYYYFAWHWASDDIAYYRRNSSLNIIHPFTGETQVIKDINGSVEPSADGMIMHFRHHTGEKTWEDQYLDLRTGKFTTEIPQGE